MEWLEEQKPAGCHGPYKVRPLEQPPKGQETPAATTDASTGWGMEFGWYKHICWNMFAHKYIT